LILPDKVSAYHIGLYFILSTLSSAYKPSLLESISQTASLCAKGRREGCSISRAMFDDSVQISKKDFCFGQSI